MQDTIIIPGMYAYQLRIDIDSPEKFNENYLAFISHHKIANYLGKIETAPKTLKLHFQSIFWTEQKLQSLPKIRNWWKPRSSNTAQPVSLTSAKKIVSLASYTQKDKGKMLTNLTDEQLFLIPKWNPNGLKKTQRERFIKNVEEAYRLRNYDGHVQYLDTGYSAIAFYEMVNNQYYLVYDRPLLHRNTYISLAYKYQIISFNNIRHYLNLPH